MKDFFVQLAMMFGRAARKPEAGGYTARVRDMMKAQKTPAAVARRKELIAEEKARTKIPGKWRWRRWTAIIVINAMFIVSFWYDVQLVEGALTASRFFGFHMADPTAALQVILASREVVLNLLIGTVTVLFVWWLVGGRSFCAWTCPYHLLSEIGEMIHLRLARLGLAKDFEFNRGLRTVLWVFFMAAALLTGYTIFEYINPVGIVSRALIYGPAIALLWVAFILGIEIFFSRRFWCRYVCPMGLTYSALGAISPVQIKYDMDKCLHEGECRKVCLVPHVLEMTKIGYASDTILYPAADCTRCGMCVDICPQDALTFDIRGLNKLL